MISGQPLFEAIGGGTARFADGSIRRTIRNWLQHRLECSRAGRVSHHLTFPQSFGDLIGKIPVPEKVANVCFGGSTRDRLYICGHTSLYANSREYSRRAGALEWAPSAGEDDGGCPEFDASRRPRRDRYRRLCRDRPGDRGNAGCGRGARVVLADLDKETAERAAAEMRALERFHVTAIVAHVADEANDELDGAGDAGARGPARHSCQQCRHCDLAPSKSILRLAIGTKSCRST